MHFVILGSISGVGFFDLTVSRTFLRLATAAALVAALGLAACGRKAGLDPPPAAAAAGDQGQPGAAPPPDSEDADGKPIAPPGQKKSFILDWLLN